MEDVIPGEVDSEELEVGSEDRRGRLVGYSLPYAITILALPVMGEQSLSLLVGLVDTYLTGQYLQQEHLAAIGMVSYILWLIPALMSSVSIGVGSLVSRFFGARDYGAAVKATNQAIGLGLLIGLGLCLMGSVGASTLPRWIGLQDGAQEAARDYLQILVPALPFMAMQFVGIAALRAAGDTVSGLVSMILVNGINAGLSFALVTGWGPFPKIGWPGLAWGTSIGYITGGSIVLGLLIAGRRGLALSPRAMIPSMEWYLRLLRIGIPGGMDMIATVTCHLWFIGIINSLGTLASAAHGLAIRVESLAYIPCNAFTAAASTLAGQLLGAKQPKRAFRSVLIICGVAMMCMVGVGVLFLMGSRPLVEVFVGSKHEALLPVVVGLLQTIAWGLPALAVVNVIGGALRGAGDTRGPLVMTLTSLLGVRIPLTYFLCLEQAEFFEWIGITPLGWGLAGAWYAMLIELSFRATLFAGRFYFGPWSRLRV